MLEQLKKALAPKPDAPPEPVAIARIRRSVEQARVALAELRESEEAAIGEARKRFARHAGTPDANRCADDVAIAERRAQLKIQHAEGELAALEERLSKALDSAARLAELEQLVSNVGADVAAIGDREDVQAAMRTLLAAVTESRRVVARGRSAARELGELSGSPEYGEWQAAGVEGLAGALATRLAERFTYDERRALAQLLLQSRPMLAVV